MIALSKKVCLLGDFAVGKTSLVRRFVYDLFDDRYISTIGVKVSRKVIAVPREGEVVELTVILWDLAGSEEFDSLRVSYLRGAAGAVLVCDLTRPETLESCRMYADELRSVNPAARFVLAANKRDLVGSHHLTEEQIAAAAAGLAIPHYLTSAKVGDDVEAVFRDLGRQLTG